MSSGCSLPRYSTARLSALSVTAAIVARRAEPPMPQSSVELGYPADAELVSVEGIPSVPAAFQRTVRRFPDAIAYRTVDDSIRLTWSQAADAVKAWSAALSVVVDDTGAT